MEIPLTPIDFARRARKLYGDREAVVDGDLRLTYEQFLNRCDRWSASCNSSASGKAIASPTSRRILMLSSNRFTQCRRLARCWCRSITG